MEELYIHPLLRNKNSALSKSRESVHRQFSSPNLEAYREMTSKYRKYLDGFNSKIDKICEKQNQKNIFKERKLNSIRSQLLKQKHQLQHELSQKRDPSKNQNGIIFKQITSLKKLQNSYQQLHSNLQKSIIQKQRQHQQLVAMIQEQNQQLKNQLKQQYIVDHVPKKNTKTTTLSVSRAQSIQSNQSRSSYHSKSRETFLNKLNTSYEVKIKNKLNFEQEKLMMLQLLCVYARSHPEGWKSQVVDSIERETKLKAGWLGEIREILGSQELARSPVYD